MKKYKISELAKLAGVTSVALRYYEKIGLLKPISYSESGYRLYGNNEIERIKFINNAKILGLKLEEIKQLLEFIDNEASSNKIKSLITKKTKEIELKLAQLKQLQQQLLEVANACDGKVEISKCPILLQLKA